MKKANEITEDDQEIRTGLFSADSMLAELIKFFFLDCSHEFAPVNVFKKRMVQALIIALCELFSFFYFSGKDMIMMMNQDEVQESSLLEKSQRVTARIRS